MSSVNKTKEGTLLIPINNAFNAQQSPNVDDKVLEYHYLDSIISAEDVEVHREVTDYVNIL